MSHVKQPRATASEDLSTQKKETYTKISIDKWKAICLLRVIYVPMQAHTHTRISSFSISLDFFFYTLAMKSMEHTFTNGLITPTLGLALNILL